MHIEFGQDLEKLDTSTFRLVKGFRVVYKDTGEFGKHIALCDSEGNKLAGFPYIDHADAHIDELISKIRTATALRPFWDGDQAWEILIWRVADLYHFMEGDSDPFGEFVRAYSVDAVEFLRVWEDTAELPRSAFSSLQLALQHLLDVRSLLLEDQGLKIVPPEVFDFPNLEYLSLFNNHLEEIPPEIVKLKNLTNLNVGINPLRSLPAELDLLPKLEFVDIICVDSMKSGNWRYELKKAVDSKR